MIKLKYYLLSVLLIFVVLISGCLNKGGGLDKAGEGVNVDIQTPHPYVSSNGGKVLIWSYTLQHPRATLLKLHFKKFEIKGMINSNTPTIFEEVDYGKCDLNAPEGYKRELVDSNTIKETQIVKQESGGAPLGSLRFIKCGVVQEKKQFTPQEIFDNYNEYVLGDFVAIKDNNGKVLDVLVRESLPKFGGSPEDFLREDIWGQTYHDIDSITIELYADESDNGYGLNIDKYIYGFS